MGLDQDQKDWAARHPNRGANNAAMNNPFMRTQMGSTPGLGTVHRETFLADPNNWPAPKFQATYKGGPLPLAPKTPMDVGPPSLAPDSGAGGFPGFTLGQMTMGYPQYGPNPSEQFLQLMEGLRMQYIRQMFGRGMGM